MRAWYFPSWNGDIRAEADPNDEKLCQLVVVSPTVAEKKLLELLAREFKSKGWHDGSDLWLEKDGKPYRDKPEQTTSLSAPVAEVGKLLAKLTKSGAQTLTAVVLRDGRVETVEGSDVDLDRVVEEAGKKAEKAATVKRPTPCCPRCEPGAIGPASRVLLEFLSPEQHEDWAAHRAVVAIGGTTGHRYVIAHRNSSIAVSVGWICFDADDRVPLSFHDWSVPPEEEVLAALLILTHREAWLRNEATNLSGGTNTLKNPFGDIFDGTDSTSLTCFIGSAVLGAIGGAATRS